PTLNPRLRGFILSAWRLPAVSARSCVSCMGLSLQQAELAGISPPPAKARPAPAAPPRVLVINAFRWLSSAQAARTFHDSGAVVSVLCPTGHPLAGLPFARAVHHYSTLHPLKSLKDAIAASKPDMLV